MENSVYTSVEELEAGLDDILDSPKESGVVEMIVCRPGVDEREILFDAVLDPATGLEGDSWHTRGNSHTPGRTPDPDSQLTLINTRVIALVAQSRKRWALVGDQLYVDLDLSAANMPPGTQLSTGSAVIEITAQPRSGCRKFSTWFGPEALKFINAPERKNLNLRGVYARVIHAGTIQAGDMIRKRSVMK